MTSTCCNDPDALRRTLGYLPQDFGVYPRVSAYEMLEHIAVLKGYSARGERRTVVETLLNQVNLWDVRHKSLAGFSGGMRQRFGIAQSLIGQPQLIIVDEPTAGLDPEEANRFLNLLSEIAENTVVILSTHIVQDAANLCPRTAIMVGGRGVRRARRSELIAGLQRTHLAEDHRQGRARCSSGHPRGHRDPPASRQHRDPRAGGRESGRRVFRLRKAASRTSTSRRSLDSSRGLRHRTCSASVARFELRYQLKSPIFWITSARLLLVRRSRSSYCDEIQFGWGGYVVRNSPYTIALMCMVLTVFAIFIATTFAATVVLRDDETGFGPIVRATPVTKSAYLFGRFAGGFLVCCLVFLSVPLGALVGAAMPGLDPETRGTVPARPLPVLVLRPCRPDAVRAGGGRSLRSRPLTRSMFTTYVVALVGLCCTS